MILILKESLKFNLGLARNVSYIHAVDTNSQPITYSIVSDYFTVNAQTGQIFLVAYLDTEPDIPTDFMDLKIKASTLKYSYQILNRIKIADVNDRAPELMSEKRTFEIIEVESQQKKFYLQDLNFLKCFYRLRQILIPSI